MMEEEGVRDRYGNTDDVHFHFPTDWFHFTSI